MDFNTTMIFFEIAFLGLGIIIVLSCVLDKLAQLIKLLKKEKDNEKPA